MANMITSCPVNCYSTCGMVAVVEDGRIVSLEPNPGNKATGTGICLKGLSHIERVYSKDRILTPLLKKNKNGSPEFQPVKWTEAIDIIAEQLLLHREKYGPQSILYYTASGQKGLLNQVGMNFFKLFGGCTTQYGDLCWQAGLEATRLTLGANKHNAPWDIKNADLILLWGKNPAETNIHHMQFINEALDNQARLVMIDPRRTQSAERAERVLQIRPGTDGALALAIANQLIETRRIDQAFIDRYVLGFEEFKLYAKSFSLEKAASLTGVPANEIKRLSNMISQAKAMTICCGFGMQRFTNSGQTFRAIIALAAITGNLGRPGAGWVYANLQSAIFNDVPSPQDAYPPAVQHGPVRIGVSTARLGADILKADNPPIKMALIARANPVSQNPDTHTVLKAFRSLNFRVTVEHFMTDTAMESDLILPGASMFEQTDISTCYWHPYIQIRQKIIEPVGAAKPETEIFYLLARKLGYDDGDMQGKIPSPDPVDVSRFLSEKLAPFENLSLDLLKQGPILAPGWEEIAFSDFKFPTPSGRIELLSNQAHELWGVNSLPEFLSPKEFRSNESKSNPPYPLYLLTPNTKNRIHSQFNNLSAIRQFSKAPFAQINPFDAAERGIEDGDRIKIYNDRGSFTADALLDMSIRAGCVSVHNGWWLSEGGGVNFCSLGRETDMGYGAAFHDNLVQVERF